jgi:hypothetical protein
VQKVHWHQYTNQWTFWGGGCKKSIALTKNFQNSISISFPLFQYLNYRNI